MLSDAGTAVASLPETSDWKVLALIVYAAAHTLLGDNERRHEMHTASLMTIDGNAAARIAAELAAALSAKRETSLAKAAS